MSKPWVIMPAVNGLAMTEQAIYDCLGQTVEPNVLFVGQGVDTPMRVALERMAEKFPDRLFCWFCDPPILSLSGVWNRALKFVWETGSTRALVVNNDLRLYPETYWLLSGVMTQAEALFVSAVGVTEGQFKPGTDPVKWELDARGGPDFSCFLISKAGHDKYPFDENFIPAFCEDLDSHRRYMLGGDGHRIFSVNVPYLHFASQTLKTATPERRAAIEKQISGARAYYAKKWGGPVNEEKYWEPFNPDAEVILLAAHVPQPTTPALQAHLRATQTI